MMQPRGVFLCEGQVAEGWSAPLVRDASGACAPCPYWGWGVMCPMSLLGLGGHVPHAPIGVGGSCAPCPYWGWGVMCPFWSLFACHGRSARVASITLLLLISRHVPVGF